MNNVRWLALAGMAFGGVGLSGAAQAAAYDMHYSFYVTNTYPGGGPTVCTGQCLIDFAESIGIEPPADLYGEFYVEASGVSRFYEQDGGADLHESYYPSRSGSTQVGNVDWGKIDIHTYYAGGPYVSCYDYQIELGYFANTCSPLAYGTVPTLGALAAAGTYSPVEIPVDLGNGMLGTDGYATFTKVPDPGTLTLKTSTVAGCRSVTGTITLNEPAPPAGVLVVLGDTLPSASVPASLTIPAGGTSKSFTITTVPVTQEQSGTVGAMIGSEPLLSKALTVRPMGLSFINFSPSSVAGGNSVSAKATLECKAGPGPIEVVLASSNAAVANPVASSIFVPQGLQTATFDLTTQSVTAKTSATISGTANGIAKSRTLTVLPAASVSPTSLKFVNVPVGTTSGMLKATLTNKGVIAFSINSITLTGTGATYFAKSSNCGATLAAGASCAIGVTFKPTTTFSKSAKISIATSATATPSSVSLSGKGI